jgi:CheY-like chemotaxis protein
MVNKKIAWIEDDADEIAVVVKPLIRAGFEFKYYHNYREALDNLEEIRKCDLILLDLIIPPGEDEGEDQGINTDEYLGKLLPKRLRSEFDIDIPVIVLSVVADTNGIEEEDKEALNVVTLSKPVRPSRLKTEVYKLLGLQEE